MNFNQPKIEDDFFDKEKKLDLSQIEKRLPFKERIDELFKNKVLYENAEGKRYIVQPGTRIAVIADINSIKVPFYQSSRGTSGKVGGEWYPFFGNRGSWLIKGKTEDSKRGYDIPEIKKMMEYLNQVLPEYLYDNLLNEEQQKLFNDDIWKSQVGTNEQVKQLPSNKQFIINVNEAAEYMAKILGYELKNAPGEDVDPKRWEFLNQVIKSIKQKLEIYKEI
ncbi:MAG: hypothetical protein WC603_00840 [Candidatus Paceibacterota bacterium]|jgi:hypothetical protein